MVKKRSSRVNTKPESGVYEYNQKDRSKAYRVIYRFWRKDNTVGQTQRRGFVSLQAANEFRRQMQKEFDDKMRPIDDQITLGDYLDRWAERYVVNILKQTTVDGYLVNIRHIKKLLGSVKLCRLSHRNIIDCYSTLQNKKSDSTSICLELNSIKYIQRVLRKALEDAVREKIIRENPADGIRLSGNSSFVYSVLTVGEIPTLREAIVGTPLHIPVNLSLSLGLRRGEVVGLRWSDINFETNTISIRNNRVRTSKGTLDQTPKSKSGIRDLPAPAQLMQLLALHKEDQEKAKSLLGDTYNQSGYVCCKPDGSPYTPSWISKLFRKTIDALPITAIRYHDLRHTFATLALENNVPLKVVSYILGHSTIAVTANVYSHVLEPNARRHTESIASIIFPE